MSDILLIGGVFVACIIVVILAGVTLQLQHKGIERLHAQQLAWEKAQEIQRQHWEAQQNKHFHTLETTQEVQRQHWEAQQDKHFHTLEKALLQNIEETALLEHKRLQYEQTRVKHELNHLPRIEDTPLPLPGPHDRIASTSNRYQPRNFQGADLSHTNLTYRYLRHADLRHSNLSHANLFMADLTGACLRGANLSEADLSATNLSAADLTGATLTHANMLVTDFHKALLIGANLLHARHLTAEQVRSAVIDETTQLDQTINLTRPHHPPIPLS